MSEFNGTESFQAVSFNQVVEFVRPLTQVLIIIQTSLYNLIEFLSIQIPQIIYSIPLPSEYIGSLLIILVSLISVIIGSYSTISKPKLAIIPDTNSKNFHSSDNDNCKYYILNQQQLDLENSKQFTWLHTALIPISSCIGLYGLYYSMNNWSIETVNKFMNIYSISVSPIMIYSTLDYLLTSSLRKLRIQISRFRLILVQDQNLPLGIIDSSLSPKKILSQYPNYIHIWKPSNKLKKNQPQTNFIFDIKPLFLIPITSFIVNMFYNFTPAFSSRSTNWLVSNLIAFCFTVSAINQLQFGKFNLVIGLLSALFFYDIYFVFFTEIMETVATGLSIPIKFIFPKNGDLPQKFLLIGLGDLVLPGSFLSLCLRFDYYQFYQSNKIPFHHLNPIPKPYFITGLLSYVLSLIITTIVMHVTKSGQPALLYIVPCLFLGISYQAWKHGQFTELWQFNDDLEKLPEKEKEKGKNDENDEDNEEVEEDEEEDADDDYQQESNDSYDDWEDRVEMKRQLDQNYDDDDDDDDEGNKSFGWEDRVEMKRDQDTDVDREEDIIYQFLSSDDDDDTFIIGDDEEEEEEEDSEDDEAGYEHMVIVDEEIDINTLKLDLSQPVREWYDEED